jgi:hypothetical protein
MTHWLNKKPEIRQKPDQSHVIAAKGALSLKPEGRVTKRELRVIGLSP